MSTGDVRNDSAPLCFEHGEAADTPLSRFERQVPPLSRTRQRYLTLGALCLSIAVVGSVLLSRKSSNPSPPSSKHELPADVRNTVLDIQQDLKRIVEYSVNGPGKGEAWNRAARICDLFGPRQVGSQNLEAAIDDIASHLTQEQFDNVYFEELPVPRWLRGAENLQLLKPLAVETPRSLAMLGLGRSVGTGPGIEADVLVVKDLEDLVQHAHLAVGKIVVFYWKFDNYATGRTLRSNCASFVAKVGGVAAGISSLASFSLASPHTGTVKYRAGMYTAAQKRSFVPDFFLGNYTDIPHIPAFALAVEDAAMLSRLHRQGHAVRVRLQMGAVNGESRTSRNLVAEIRGSELPEEVVTIGAHLDSWDVSCGAQDDLGPAVVQWEVMSMLRAVAVRPRRTVRMVLFTAEEIGSLGGWHHYRQHEADTERLSAIFDIDSGIFHFCGIAVAGDAQTLETLRVAAEALADIASDRVESATFRHASNMYMFPASIPALSPLQAPLAVVQAGHLNEERQWIESDATFQGGYWFYHHSVGDRVDALVPAQMDRAVATVAAHIYTISMLPRLLTREPYELASEERPCIAPGDTPSVDSS